MFLNKSSRLNSSVIGLLDLVNIKEILGCFCFLHSNGIILNVYRLERGYNVKSLIVDLDENSNKVTVKIEDNVYFKLNENIQISFVINSIKYSFHSFVMALNKEGEFQFHIPTSINYDDKRELPRILLPESMMNSLELVTGFFSGLRIKGSIKDLSIGGLAFTPNNIENLRNRSVIRLNEAKLKSGDRFRNFRILIEKHMFKVPGEICHLPDEERDTYGVKFHSLKAKHNDILNEYVQSLAPLRKFINFSTFYNNIKAIS